MKKVITLSLLTMLMASATASATSINLRHEFIPEKDDLNSRHRDRMTIAHTFNNGIGISGELKWGYAEDDLDLSQLRSVGQEAIISYNYKLTKSLTIQPAYGLDAGDTSVTHKLNLKGTQKLTDNWKIAARYRYGYKNVSLAHTDNSHYHQINLTSGYKVGDFGLGIDFEFKLEQEKSTGYKGHNDYLNLVNFTADYQGFESGWIPFIELGMVAQNTDKDTPAPGKDEYVARYRVGMKYNF
ncbi:oligogalacturonate-specific porin KdgM family protein [Vibrio algicola]|uniref:Porin n=1 Tax=Vibrio algicola TaxID=2662262 RepID=A0A5Q0TIQ1_9VIBR|nr:oligogalacturonate-specific porin KdgM family protein [Vibrio algicola]